jgi:hypothetical protein
MNFLKLADIPIEILVGSSTIKFNPLTIEQCGLLMTKWADAARVQLIADMKECGEKPDAISKAVRELRWRSSRLSFGYDIAQTESGVRDTLQVASGKDIGGSIAYTQGAVELALKLWGLEPKEDEQESPKSEAAKEQNATG